MNTVYILLGGNIGDTKKVFECVYTKVAESIGRIEKKSSIYKTEAWGGVADGDFLNQILMVTTELSPENTLIQLLNIEKFLGRERLERWGNRVIDLDILFYNEIIFNTAYLHIPHPKIAERKFVLIPLHEIAPQLVHPTLGKSIFELLNASTDSLKVSKI